MNTSNNTATDEPNEPTVEFRIIRTTATSVDVPISVIRQCRNTQSLIDAIWQQVINDPDHYAGWQDDTPLYDFYDEDGNDLWDIADDLYGSDEADHQCFIALTPPVNRS